MRKLHAIKLFFQIYPHCLLASQKLDSYSSRRNLNASMKSDRHSNFLAATLSEYRFYVCFLVSCSIMIISQDNKKATQL
ncbi:hypothetical protein Plhal304r1_c004g0017641 [Plasmopara halstedii]